MPTLTQIAATEQLSVTERLCVQGCDIPLHTIVRLLNCSVTLTCFFHLPDVLCYGRTLSLSPKAKQHTGHNMDLDCTNSIGVCHSSLDSQLTVTKKQNNSSTPYDGWSVMLEIMFTISSSRVLTQQVNRKYTTFYVLFQDT